MCGCRINSKIYQFGIYMSVMGYQLITTHARVKKPEVALSTVMHTFLSRRTWKLKVEGVNDRDYRYTNRWKEGGCAQSSHWIIRKRPAARGCDMILRIEWCPLSPCWRHWGLVYRCLESSLLCDSQSIVCHLQGHKHSSGRSAWVS